MAHAHDYSIVSAQERVTGREIVHLDANRSGQNPVARNVVIVPFAGLNGQQIAGTGALVWEGELLQPEDDAAHSGSRNFRLAQSSGYAL